MFRCNIVVQRGGKECNIVVQRGVYAVALDGVGGVGLQNKHRAVQRRLEAAR